MLVRTIKRRTSALGFDFVLPSIMKGCFNAAIPPSSLKYEEMRKIVLGYVLSSENLPNKYVTIVDAVAKYLVDHGHCKEASSYTYPKQFLMSTE